MAKRRSLVAWVAVALLPANLLLAEAFLGPARQEIARGRTRHQSSITWSDKDPELAFLYRDEEATTTTWTKTQSSRNRSSASESPPEFHVYCDLDGVLVDFDYGIRQLFPDHPPTQCVNALDRPTMWKHVDAQGTFFRDLPWMPEGRRLWEAIRPLQPDILTGCPAFPRSSAQDKVAWCRRELGVPVQHVDRFGRWHMHAKVRGEPSDDRCNVVTCWSFNKHYESGPNKVLIDDRLHLQESWERKGGIFIHHTSVDRTLQQLRAHGILRKDS